MPISDDLRQHWNRSSNTIPDDKDPSAYAVEREQTLDSIYTEISLLKDAYYEVTVNIFSENKLETKEGVDWSYWQAGLYEQSDHRSLFTNFVYDLNQKDVKISIYDAR